VPASRFVLDGAVLLLVDDPATHSAELMARAASHAMNLAQHDVTVERHCANCDSREHGHPSAHRSGLPAVSCSVSFSRTSGHAVAAALRGEAVGVDIESVARISSHPLDSVLLHPAERDQRDRLIPDDRARYLARLWVAKEALVKAVGIGLRVDLTQIRVDVAGNSGHLRSWPSELGLVVSPQLTLFEVDDDTIGALAVLR
jgi:phosphopantetheinyl transferase